MYCDEATDLLVFAMMCVQVQPDTNSDPAVLRSGPLITCADSSSTYHAAVMGRARCGVPVGSSLFRFAEGAGFLGINIRAKTRWHLALQRSGNIKRTPQH